LMGVVFRSWLDKPYVLWYLYKKDGLWKVVELTISSF
jgi:hypothetical protein